MNHGRIVTTESYYEGNLSSTKCEHEVSVLTDKQSLLKDIIDALAVITAGDTHTLNIAVLVNKDGQMRIVKRWTI